MRLCVRPQSHIIDLTMGKVATRTLNAEIVKAAEETVSLALQHLGKTLDYSTDSLEDVEALIQHVESRLSQLSKEGKSADQTAQSASISMGQLHWRSDETAGGERGSPSTTARGYL